jgi:TRAP-type mannitol/chloroaromatic compound transport system permease large subunit
MLVFMSDLLSLNLAKVFVAAFLPGLFLAGVYLVYLVVRAHVRPSESPPVEAFDRTGIWREALVSVSFPLVLIVAVLGSIIAGWASPTEASGVGAFAALVLGALRGRLSLSVLGEATDSSLRTIALLFFTLGLGLYPNLIISAPGAANGLTIYSAASSEKTLYIMFLIAGIGMPLVIGYTTFVYWTFRGKVKLDQHSY